MCKGPGVERNRLSLKNRKRVGGAGVQTAKQSSCEMYLEKTLR